MITRLLRLLPPEPAHNLTVRALSLGLGPRAGTPDPRLAVSLWGQRFASPLGLAAGFDKHGQAMSAALNMGFGFVEIGTLTPYPQPGNPKPRVFRAPQQQGVINRYGFNSHGHAVVRQRLLNWRQANPGAALGVNLGMNRDSPDPLGAYCAGIDAFEGLATYLVINLSSPNTQGLRDQQTRGLGDLIQGLRAAQRLDIPLLLKIAPDLTPDQIQHIAQTALDQGLDGLIISNTTLDRPDQLPPRLRVQSGGLSGAPLTQRALKTLRIFARHIRGQIPLIGVGGIMSGADAVARLRAGADLLQIYTGLLYRGPGLIQEIHTAILAALDDQGLNHPSELKKIYS